MTEAVAAAGFQDAYRSTHPDPVAAPGITWTFGTPFPRLAPDLAVDRIDMIHASAGIRVLDSGIAGPPGTADVTWPVDPYPSDHRAVAATVRLTPAAPGELVSVIERRVTRGALAVATRIRLDHATFRPGEYVVRLMRDDGYGVLDAARLTVRPRE